MVTVQIHGSFERGGKARCCNQGRGGGRGKGWGRGGEEGAEEEGGARPGELREMCAE